MTCKGSDDDHQDEGGSGCHCERLFSFPKLRRILSNTLENFLGRQSHPSYTFASFLDGSESMRETMRLILGFSVGRLANYTHPWSYFASHFLSICHLISCYINSLTGSPPKCPWISHFLITNNMRSFKLVQERNHLSSHSVRGVCSTSCIKGKEKVVFEIKDDFLALLL